MTPAGKSLPQTWQVFAAFITGLCSMVSGFASTAKTRIGQCSQIHFPLGQHHVFRSLLHAMPRQPWVRNFTGSGSGPVPWKTMT